MTARDGFRFRPPRLLEVAPHVYVAHGYDFADIAFVLTNDGVVAIDAGNRHLQIPAVIPETDEQRRRYEDAGRRRETRRLELERRRAPEPGGPTLGCRTSASQWAESRWDSL